MDQALKGDAGQCQETTKVQGKKIVVLEFPALTALMDS